MLSVSMVFMVMHANHVSINPSPQSILAFMSIILRPYLFDLMLRGPDRLHISSNEIILKITCADHVYLIKDNTSSTPS